MSTFFYLSSCDTCKKIRKQLPERADIDFQDIKKAPLTEAQLEELHALAGSYEALFSRKAQLYKSMGLKDKNLQEADFKRLILEHYTFLNRPVLLNGKAIFIGNKPETVAAMVASLS